jgi:hypothetical protein
MDGYQCMRCTRFWASNSLDGKVITRVCPTCIPLVYPRTMTDVELLREGRPDEPVRQSVEERMDAMLLGTAQDEPLSFGERYCELRSLGYADWQIAKRFGITNNSLLRQLERYGIEPRQEFASLCAVERREREQAS